ncbi:MAG: hypothetical protein EOM21_19700 [Gammaproteobacteria bacterium]|nr:hypothetical protein [Gammaproteobacteria bacterium]
MKTLSPVAGTQELIDLWQKAKDAELAWVNHRREVEARILDMNKDAIEEVKQSLEADRKLSTSVGLDGLELRVAREIELDQAEAALFAAAYPSLVTIVLKAEFKPVAKGVLSTIAKSETELGREVAAMVSFKDAKVSFSKAKS